MNFLCPQTTVFTSDYAFCPFISAMCPIKSPFKCLNNVCTDNPTTGCCDNGMFWCPHSGQCVQQRGQCCSLDQKTPIFCNETQKCVSFEYECCSNYKTYVTENTMVKCSHENKCVPIDTAEFCFTPFDSGCFSDFPIQCPFDGKCVRDLSDCASTRVCPPGYFMCPDYTCLPGLAQYPLCKKLPACTAQTNLLGRCSDGLTCSDDLQMCPTQVTCPRDFVVCPDNTCVKSQYLCRQPPTQLAPKLGSCGFGLIRCPDGSCQSSCTNLIVNDCWSLGLFRCPETFECVESYDACPSPTYCPIPSAFTYSIKSIICEQGPKICTWDVQRCLKTGCQSPQNYFGLIDKLKPWPAYDNTALRTCADGRCSQYGCVTEVSCSNYYPIKSQIVGYHCTLNEQDADEIAEVAYKLQAFKCPPNLVMCLSGHCRPTINDCPQDITCPSKLPILCQDGSCVSSKDQCRLADITISQQQKQCTNRGLLLCQSDLQTCVTSVEQCPTMSTCPFGFTKCTENKCALDWSCANDVKQCNSINSIYCRSLNLCVSRLDACPKLTKCPDERPVKCASDQSCQTSISLCPPFTNTYISVPLQLSVVQSTSSCGSDRLFRCKDGNCRAECDEWQPCPYSGQVQCYDGRCVADSKLCPNSENGCPWNLPFFCPYQAACVSDVSMCLAEKTAQQSLNTYCKTQYGSNHIGCPSGSCILNGQTCKSQFTASCSLFMFPNNITNPRTCFNFQCPPSIPFKCQNGLCVSRPAECQVQIHSAQEINRCLGLSLEAGIDLRYPCGDGSCAFRPEECLPLYKCSSNSNGLTFRCNDGTCKSQKKDCPQLPQPYCGFRCSTGQCVAKQADCATENGCTVAQPYRCESNGMCVETQSQCTDLFKTLEKTALDYQPVDETICESRGLFTCSTGTLVYCASSLSRCYSTETGCPVTAPILCNQKCVKSITDCTNGITPYFTETACSPLKPFRCTDFSMNGCKALPFASSAELYANTCSTQTPSLVGLYPINRCSSAKTPYSCTDGSCVGEPNLCKSCPHFCLQTMTCTTSSDECQQYGLLKSQNQIMVYQQICPVGAPIRCVITGECVQNAIQCTQKISAAYDNAFVSTLASIQCSSETPIRCVTGRCVSLVVECFSSVQIDAQQMVQPLPWGLEPAVQGQTCQVYCADGSCRDRQENCPLAQACINPYKPFRCMNGFCASNQTECVDLYGNEELDSRSGDQSAFCLKHYNERTLQSFVKCPDGSCRPATYNDQTKQYEGKCLKHIGCPLSAAYQCPTGHCVMTKEDCKDYSNKLICPEYMCKNMQCVSDPSLCDINLSLSHVLQLQIDVSPYEELKVDLSFNNTEPIASLFLPKGSLVIDYTDQITFAQDVYGQLRLNPDPDQYRYLSNVESEALQYAGERYHLQQKELLSGQDSLLSPIFSIETDDEFTGAELHFKLDLPYYFDLISDVCLASVQEQGRLVCVSRQMTVMDDGYIAFTLDQLDGRYAAIFNPQMTLKTSITPLVPPPIDEPDADVGDQCTSFFCRYKWWLAGCISGLIVFVGALVWLYCRQQRMSRLSETQKQLNEPGPSQVKRYENLFTETEVEERVKEETQEALRLAQDNFKSQLIEKDRTILQLQQSVKTLSLQSPISKASLYKMPEFNEELKNAQEKIKQHYSSEVQRIAETIRKEAYESAQVPIKELEAKSRGSLTKLKQLQIEAYSSQERVQPSKPNLSAKYQTERQPPQNLSKLDQQWNKLVDEYKPPVEFMSQNSQSPQRQRAQINSIDFYQKRNKNRLLRYQ